ncbi:hypothetical protein VP01_2402g1 [Puccinia sorghi]|uniref:Uncharacterized protein n=1 Tax=Puccinia sorghi TaxID=27349 RepID=A0A0L6V8K4_9BASI|nr:hypothetical protein VP01_2402g1 [Puccinia sorghi]
MVSSFTILQTKPDPLNRYRSFPEVRDLIHENVIQNGMSVAKVMESFKVYCGQIQRIKSEDPISIKVNNKKAGNFTK